MGSHGLTLSHRIGQILHNYYWLLNSAASDWLLYQIVLFDITNVWFVRGAGHQVVGNGIAPYELWTAVNFEHLSYVSDCHKPRHFGDPAEKINIYLYVESMGGKKKINKHCDNINKSIYIHYWICSNLCEHEYSVKFVFLYLYLNFYIFLYLLMRCMSLNWPLRLII